MPESVFSVVSLSAQPTNAVPPQTTNAAARNKAMPRFFCVMSKIFSNRIFNSSFPPEKAVLICIFLLFVSHTVRRIAMLYASRSAMPQSAITARSQESSMSFSARRAIPCTKGLKKCNALANSKIPLNQRSFLLQCVSPCFKISRISAGSLSSELR